MDASLPTNVQEFGGDDRISFSKLDNKFLAVLDDGAELEFEADSGRWVPAAVEPLDEEDALEYGGGATPDPNVAFSNKRKNGEINGSEVSSQLYTIHVLRLGHAASFDNKLTTRFRAPKTPDLRVPRRSRRHRHSPNRIPQSTSQDCH